MQGNSEQPQGHKRSSRFWLAGITIAAVLLLAVGTAVLSPTLRVSPALSPAPVTDENIASTSTSQDKETYGGNRNPGDQLPPLELSPQAGGRSAGDLYTPELGNTGYDVQRYTLRLALDPADDTVRGTTTIEALTTVAGLVELSLDFAGFEVTAVTVDGIGTNFLRENHKLIIALPKIKDSAEPLTVEVTYHGSPLIEPSAYLKFVDHLGIHRPGGKSLFVIAEPDGARYWFPSNDHPRDKATFRFEVVVPSGLTAVANGELVRNEPAVMPGGGDGELFVWVHPHSMAPYLAFVAVAEYVRLDGMTPAGVPLRHYAFPGLEQELLHATDEVGLALDWMAQLVGPYPFEKFGYVTAHIPGASMETQDLVLLSSTMIGERTAVHELAHMWFGDWVSLHSWEEMWRNEGFATYFQLMWETGDDPEELALRMAALEGIVEGNDKEYPLNHPPPQYLFELNIYYKGALAVHALREEMGDEVFFAGLQEYFRRYGGRTASDAEFRAVMEESLGRSLQAYYDEWFPGS